MDIVLVELGCLSKPRISLLGFTLARARGCCSIICFVLFMFIYGTILRAYLVRNPDRNPDRNIFLRSILARFLVRYIILRFILWSILDRNSFTLIALRSILARFLVRKWNDMIDGGLPPGPEIECDPAGLPQFFPCPFD
mgnify:CR=1 FL=1